MSWISLIMIICIYSAVNRWKLRFSCYYDFYRWLLLTNLSLLLFTNYLKLYFLSRYKYCLTLHKNHSHLIQIIFLFIKCGTVMMWWELKKTKCEIILQLKSLPSKKFQFISGIMEINLGPVYFRKWRVIFMSI